ncbi:GNAT family N-acetyltransferase [Nonomuraea sp. FMUSA5-5]|uniref:GNAT family N-acetyltransferase n=1 Tax=Nonomuraea composti TaxID=2720023 RepID=A0ABX1BFF0_9ACTN|nr:GNAT family N-acetyltransferase [Nonomuraea sp. FMUSA5-5]NJP95212.1 GNAT family N-acetyltransferase [Nonomuraea sp. FMUSA5-5]
MDVDRLVHEAWPAYEQQPHDGWVFRCAGGVTKRANSVLPVGLPADLPGAIAAAEAFYAERGLPCVFSVGPGAPAGLDEELERRGYALVDPTLVMAGTPKGEPVPRVRIEDRPWPEWLETWWAVDGRYGSGLEEATRICAGVPAWYAAYEEDGVPVAVGRGVPQGDTLGIYCMATLPGARRRGLGRAVLRGLVARAGGGPAYLVVTAGNAGAQALYRGEGFEVTGQYHYRVR